jgi:hypothetical protein
MKFINFNFIKFIFASDLRPKLKIKTIIAVRLHTITLHCIYKNAPPLLPNFHEKYRNDGKYKNY